MTKSLVNLAVGLLIAEGHLSSIDLPCHQIYPQWKGGEKEVITVRHLLTHTSGIAEDWEKDQMQQSPDIVQLILDSPLSEPPGTEFRYNNKATTLLADMVYRLSGEPVDLYLDKRLFQPLGIRNYTWSKDPKGQRYGHAGTAFTSYDLLKIGQLLLNNGQWDGRQLVPPSWIALSTQGATPLNCVCGLLWWIELDPNNAPVGYSARGYKGQYLIVLPSRGIVAVRQSDISGYATPPPDGKISFANFPKLVGQL